MEHKICSWVKQNNPQYLDYHNNEWGKAIHDDDTLFELFSLETQSSGLSWLTVLKKRAGYREVFENFSLENVASYTKDDVNRILESGLVIKSRPKIEAIINNAKLFLQIKKEFSSLDNYFWSRTNHKTIVNDVVDYKLTCITSEISDELAKDLKKRGFKFVGSVTVYAFLQACGIVNDHENDCWCK